METEHGREFVSELLNITGVEAGGFHSDPCYNSYLIGKASIGTSILSLIRSSEKGLRLEQTMRLEARARPAQEKEDDFYKQFKEE